MADEIGRGVIVLSVDGKAVAVGVDDAKRKLGELEHSATKSAGATSAAFTNAGSTVQGATGKMDSATKRWIQSIEREIASISKSRDQYREWEAQAKGIPESVYAPLISRLTAAKAATDALATAEGGLRSVGLSARQTQQALRQLPAQLTDVFTSLASGMPIYMVAIQQGGQIKDSFHGIGNAAREVGTYFKGLITNMNPVVAAIGGVIAAVASYIAIAKEASDETKLFNTAIMDSGGTAGTSAEEFQNMAKRIGDTIGTQRQASLAISELARSGRISSASIEGVGRAAVTMERLTGKAIKDTVAQFVELSKAPYEASVKLNEQLNYLNAATLERIRNLELEGKAALAASVAMTTFAEASESRAFRFDENLGTLERLWRNVKNAISDATDALINFGRKTTEAEKVVNLEAQLAEAEARKGRGRGMIGPGGRDAQIAAIRERLESARETLRLADEESIAATSQLNAQKTATKQAEAYLKLQEDLEKVESRKAAWIERQVALRRIETGGRMTEKDERDYRALLDPPKKAPEFKNDAATKLIQDANQRNAVLQQAAKELDLAEAIGAEMKKLIEFETLISDLQRKGRLENSEKEILSKKDIIRLILEENVQQENINDGRKESVALAKRLADEVKKEAEQREKNIASIREYAVAQHETLQDMLRGYEAERAQFSAGEKERARAAARGQISERYRGESNRLTADYVNNKINADQLKALLRINEDNQELALRGWEEHYAAIEELSKSRLAGAEKALRDFVDESENLARQSEQAWGDAFRGIGDEVAEFVRTGKTDFKALVNSFLADIVRLNVNNFFAQILKLGLSAAAGSSTAAGQAPVYDSRTPGVGLARGTNYVPYDGFRAVLHEGESVVPKAFNPAAAGGGGDTNVTVNVSAPVEPMSEWRLSQTIRDAAIAGVREKQLRGGGL